MTRKKNLNAKMDNALTRITSVMEISTARINLMRVFSFAPVSLLIKFSFHEFTLTANIYRYKAIGANATSSVILYTGKCISPCLEIL